MTKNLPAYRYEIFIKAFEAKVAAHQSLINDLRRMEQPYNLVKGALEAARLPNEQAIAFDSTKVRVNLTAMPGDLLCGFEPLVFDIGERLFKAELHCDGNPSIEMGGFLCRVVYRWRFRDWFREARVSIDIPEGGLRDLDVEKVPRVIQTEDYRLTRVEPPAHPAPAGFNSRSEV